MYISIEVLSVLWGLCCILCFLAGYWLGRSSINQDGWEDEAIWWRENAWPVIEKMSKHTLETEEN